jgi:dihydrofolate reductase
MGVIWHVTMSLDGFIAGPDDDMDPILEYAGPNPVVDELLPTIGAILAGRRSYDVGRREEGHGAYGGAIEVPTFVLTDREAPDEKGVTFLSGDIRAAVQTANRAAAGRHLVLLGAHVAEQCLEAHLVDEILVHVAPVLLGDGTRLFGRPGLRVELDPTHTSRAGRVTNLRYRVSR